MSSHDVIAINASTHATNSEQRRAFVVLPAKRRKNKAPRGGGPRGACARPSRGWPRSGGDGRLLDDLEGTTVGTHEAACFGVRTLRTPCSSKRARRIHPLASSLEHWSHQAVTECCRVCRRPQGHPIECAHVKSVFRSARLTVTRMCCAADDQSTQSHLLWHAHLAAAGSLPTANTLQTAHVLVARDAVRGTARDGLTPVMLKGSSLDATHDGA